MGGVALGVDRDGLGSRARGPERAHKCAAGYGQVAAEAEALGNGHRCCGRSLADGQVANIDGAVVVDPGRLAAVHGQVHLLLRVAQVPELGIGANCQVAADAQIPGSMENGICGSVQRQIVLDNHRRIFIVAAGATAAYCIVEACLLRTTQKNNRLISHRGSIYHKVVELQAGRVHKQFSCTTVGLRIFNGDGATGDAAGAHIADVDTVDPIVVIVAISAIGFEVAVCRNHERSARHHELAAVLHRECLRDVPLRIARLLLGLGDADRAGRLPVDQLATFAADDAVGGDGAAVHNQLCGLVGQCAVGVGDVDAHRVVGQCELAAADVQRAHKADVAVVGLSVGARVRAGVDGGAGNPERGAAGDVEAVVLLGGAGVVGAQGVARGVFGAGVGPAVGKAVAAPRVDADVLTQLQDAAAQDYGQLLERAFDVGHIGHGLEVTRGRGREEELLFGGLGADHAEQGGRAVALQCLLAAALEPHFHYAFEPAHGGVVERRRLAGCGPCECDRAAIDKVAAHGQHAVAVGAAVADRAFGLQGTAAAHGYVAVDGHADCGGQIGAVGRCARALAGDAEAGAVGERQVAGDVHGAGRQGHFTAADLEVPELRAVHVAAAGEADGAGLQQAVGCYLHVGIVGKGDAAFAVGRGGGQCGALGHFEAAVERQLCDADCGVERHGAAAGDDGHVARAREGMRVVDIGEARTVGGPPCVVAPAALVQGIVRGLRVRGHAQCKHCQSKASFQYSSDIHKWVVYDKFVIHSLSTSASAGQASAFQGHDYTVTRSRKFQKNGA